VNTEELATSDLEAADLVVMGAPTHRMNLPEALRPVLAAIPRRILRHKPVAAFDTSYKLSGWLAHFTAAHKLAQNLRKLGGPAGNLSRGRSGRPAFGWRG
jgi:NAD(P)H-dependent FMN reductase